MSEITTKSLINILPLSSDLKLELLENYDNYPQEERNRISELVWNLYYDLYDAKIQEEFEKGIRNASESGTKLDSNYFKDVVQKVNQDFEKAAGNSSDSMDLSAARKSMEQIVAAISAAKKPSPKPKLN